MKKIFQLNMAVYGVALLFFLAGSVVRSATPLDSYGGVVGTSCANPNGTKYFGIVKQGGHMLFCDPDGHLFFGRGFAPFDPGVYGADESGKQYSDYYDAKYNVGSQNPTVVWMDNNIPRMKSWGFNTIGPESSAYALPFSSAYPGGDNPNKVPSILWAFDSTCAYATMDSYGYAPQGTKNLYYVSSPSWVGTGWHGYSELADYADPDWSKYVNGDAGTGLLSQWKAASASDRSYLLGVTGCDSDYMHGFGPTADFATQPAGKNDFRLSYLVALASPVSWMEYKASGYTVDSMYPDPTVYAKKAWYTQLTSKYSTIAALNAAWGSNYTTFGTSGTCYGPGFGTWLCPSPSAAYSLGTGNGTTTTFTGTLNTDVSPSSVGIFVGGTLVGGDEGNSNWSTAPGGTSEPIYGRAGTPAVTQNSGGSGTSAWSYEVVAYPGTSIQWAFPVITTTTGPLNLTTSAFNIVSETGVLNGHAQCAVYRVSFPAGSSVTTTGLIGTNDCAAGTWDRGQAGDGSAPPAPTNGQISSGSINYTTGAISVTFVTPPPSGAAITVEYIQNGWQYGTGVMDEDGRASHVSWVGNNSICVDGTEVASACAIDSGDTSHASAGMATDLNNLDVTMAGDYASAIHSAIQAVAPGAIDFGPQPWGNWGTPPNKYVMEGMKPYVQVLDVSTGGAGGATVTQAELDYIHQTLGDIPMATYVYASANWDSSLAWPNTACSYSGSGPYTVTCTAALPVAGFSTGTAMMTSCADASYNNGDFTPATVNTSTGAITYSLGAQPSTTSTTCNLAFYSSYSYMTQAARASAVASLINSLFGQSFSADGVHPWAALFWWEFVDEQDDGGVRTDWGLADTRDNAYNGYETQTSVVKCNTVGETSYNCGGELRSGWGSDDGITPIMNANEGIDTSLAGLGARTARSSLTNGSLTNAMIH